MESGQNFQRLPELHALACGLKALVTQEVAEAIDVLRRACGGHGFMASSNLPRLWGLVTAACTYEGENTVLQLQVNHFSFHNSQCLKITQNGPKTGGSHQLISSHPPDGSDSPATCWFSSAMTTSYRSWCIFLARKFKKYLLAPLALF